MRISISKETIPRVLFTWILYEKVIFQLLAYISGIVGASDYSVFATNVYYFCYGLLAVIMLITRIHSKRRILCVESLMTILIVVTSWTLLTVNNLHVINLSEPGYNSLILFLFYLPAMALISSYENINEWIDSLFGINIFMNICALWFLTKRFSGGKSTEALLVAYMIALCLIICVFFYKNNNKRILLPLIIVDLIMLVGAGNRGAIITGLGYIVAEYIKSVLDDENNKRKIAKIIVSCLVLILIYVLYIPLLTVLSTFLKGTTLSTRAIDLFVSGNTLTSEGRDYIRELIWGRITAIPFWGYGLLGDRYLSNGLYYIHNLEMEIIIDFGWIPGGCILFYLLYRIIKALKCSRIKNAIILIGCYSVLQLQFSLSYLMSSSFWIFIGLLWASRKQVEDVNNWRNTA